MPLFGDDEKVLVWDSDQNTSKSEDLLSDLLQNNRRLARTSTLFKQSRKKVFSNSKDSLYVHQGNVEIVKKIGRDPIWIGSDDATSCNHLVFEASDKVAFIHLDFSSRFPSLDAFLNAKFAPDCEIRVYIVGGFENYCDLTVDLLKFLSKQPQKFVLKVLCSGEDNTFKKDSKAFPIHLGAAFNRITNELVPAHFELKSRNPVGVLKQLLVSFSPRLVSFYDSSQQKLELAFFDLHPLRKFFTNRSSDPRSHSTTPDQEPQTFDHEQRALSEMVLDYSNNSIQTTKLIFNYIQGPGWLTNQAASAILDRYPKLSH